MQPATIRLLTCLVIGLVACDQARCENKAKETKAGAIVLAQQHFMPAAGTSVTTDNTLSITDAAVKLKAGEQELRGTLNRTEAGKETREMLSADKYRYLLESKTVRGNMKLDGKDQAAPEKANPLVGVPVIVERRESKWTASLEQGDSPTADQQIALNKEIDRAGKDSGFDMYGDTPRKPGDKWDVDPAKLMDFGDAAGLTGKYRVEFIKVAEYHGVHCAVLKGTFDIKGKTKAEGDAPQMDIRLKGEAVSHRSIADMIDLDVEVKGTVIVDGSPAPEMSMHVEGPTRMTEKVSLKKP